MNGAAQAWAADDGGPWTVVVTAEDGHWHVRPVQGEVCIRMWGGIFGGEYGKSEWRLRRSIAKCHRWCAKQNAQEARIKAMVLR